MPVAPLRPARFPEGQAIGEQKQKEQVPQSWIDCRVSATSSVPFSYKEYAFGWIDLFHQNEENSQRGLVIHPLARQKINLQGGIRRVTAGQSSSFS